MSKEMLKNLIELVSDSDIELLYRVILKFIPEYEPLPDELEALMEGRKDRLENGSISHNDVNWD